MQWKFRFHRFDLTKIKDTLSPTSLKSLNSKSVVIKVYMQGDLPAEFKRLQQETKQF
jgi:hypothetical protein